MSGLAEAIEHSKSLSLKDQLMAIHNLLNVKKENHQCEICQKIMDEIYEEEGSTQDNIDQLLF